MSDTSSSRITGIGASPGIAVGEVHLLDRGRPRTPLYRLEAHEVEEEIARLDEALAASDLQLSTMKRRVEEAEGPENALLLEAYRLMLHDPAFAEETRALIRAERVNAERGIRRTARKIREAFGRLEDEYFRERRREIGFVADRVVRNLMGEAVDVESFGVPTGLILVARDLAPTDAAMLLHPEKVRGLVMERGTQVSHTAIIAHARGIPAVVGASGVRGLLANGDRIALDGSRGLVVLHPTTEEEAAFRKTKAQRELREKTFEEEARLRPITRDGKEVRLLANLEFEEEIPQVLHVGSQGIGLYRTEFLYIGKRRLPSEEDHAEAYRKILEQMGGLPVTFRTFDIGADKLARAKRGTAHANPALGVRALRYAYRHPGLLETQLRGMLLASAHGEMRIMFPMVSGLAEFREALAALERAKEELLARGVEVREDIPVGVMIEVPSAVMAADRLAEEADFFSIGTNDLIQYAFAVDRHNREVAYLYRPLDPSVLRMIRMTVEAAHARGIPVAVCGEMAGDPELALILLGLGIEEFSMTASSIPHVRRLLLRSSFAEARSLVNHAFTLRTAEEVEAVVRDALALRWAEPF